jgi:hypothetical protein
MFLKGEKGFANILKTLEDEGILNPVGHNQLVCGNLLSQEIIADFKAGGILRGLESSGRLSENWTVQDERIVLR